MGSTGEADRKRRHLAAISPSSIPAKKPSLLPISEDKKLDTTVLQFQNQKLCQKLEVQKIEISALENKFSRQKAKQCSYDQRLASVKKAWERLAGGLESTSLNIGGVGTSSGLESTSLDIGGVGTSGGQDIQHLSTSQDAVSSSTDNAFLRRLMETGATESCSANDIVSPVIEDEKSCEKIKNILGNLVVAADGVWGMKDKLYSASMAVPGSDSCRQRTSNDLVSEVKNMRLTLGDLHLKHKSLAREMWDHQDRNIKNKAELKRLRAELESTLKDLEENNHQLAVLKAEKDATKGLFFPVLGIANKHTAGDGSPNKQRDLLDMELSLKTIMDQSSSCLEELKHLYERRIVILKKLSEIQNTLKNVKYITSSHPFELLSKQLEKSKAELIHYQALYEKLQAERDTLSWHERQANITDDLADVFRRSCTVADSRIHDLGVEIQKQIDERKRIEVKLEESSKEPGRKEVISKFKALISSFPEEMNIMQSQLSKYKELGADVHSLRADTQCLRNVLDRKAKELETLSVRSASQEAEIQRLQAAVQDLKQTEGEFNLFVEMFKGESVLTSDVSDARDLEFKAWAHVQGLKSSLDERNLEFRVKEAIEGEASSQQRLASAEAEIADLREKWEVSKRESAKLSDVLKSKGDENDAYISEIETIGQAYDDMQNQNQQLLQQITERDDYNIKLVVEGVNARQVHDASLTEKLALEKKIQQAKLTEEFFDIKAARIENQVKLCSDSVNRHKEDRRQNAVTIESMRRKYVDSKKSSQHGKECLELLQSKLNENRASLADTQTGREKERFEKKRLQETLEALKRKASGLVGQLEGTSVVGKLRQELQEYKEILKCSICLDRAKEVVITKCFHLFCSPCVKRIMEARHRKCPVCATSFGPNDVKPVYI